MCFRDVQQLGSTSEYPSLVRMKYNKNLKGCIRKNENRRVGFIKSLPVHVQ